MMFRFRHYQEDIISRATDMVKSHGFVYLAMEVRTGKTLTSLGICKEFGAKNVLFLTKKKAISSIQGDYDMYAPNYDLTVINYESMHKAPQTKWDIVVLDEAHGLGAFPKPSKRAKAVFTLIKKTRAKVILLSGTPTPESYSQMFHQVYGIPGNPYSEFKNFYRFADRYVIIKERNLGHHKVKDYSGATKGAMDLMRPYMISFSQKDAGFEVDTQENVLRVKMCDRTYELINKLKRDLVIEGSEEVILADTAVKLMSKIHQMCSGTIKFESGNSMVLDYSKAEFIKERFKGKKIGIFYKFKEELNALKKIFEDNLCTELDEFNGTDKNIALQIVSGREGISLREADALVYYNIDFSATSYWQSRDRMTTKDRLKNDIYWVFAEKGIETKIYKTVSGKKDYTLSHFKKDFL